VASKAATTAGSGLDDLGDEGWNAIIGALGQYRLAGLPGGAQLAGSFVWSGEFSDLGGGSLLGLRAGEGLASERQSWNVVGNVWQYVQVFEVAPEGPLHLHDGRPRPSRLGRLPALGRGRQ
jgi:hypothetical protein